MKTGTPTIRTLLASALAAIVVIPFPSLRALADGSEAEYFDTIMLDSMTQPVRRGRPTLP